jgi:hypothetical protein
MSKLWGRKARVTITSGPEYSKTGKGDSGSLLSSTKKTITDIADEIVFEQGGVSKTGLKISFDINYPGIEGYYVSEVVIYNLTEDFANTAIMTGSILKLEAGYEDADTFGMIFKGYIYQVLWEKEDIINYKLTLVCMDGAALWTQQNFISTPVDRGMRYDTRMNMLLSKAVRAIPIAGEKVPDNPDYQKLHRAEVIHTQPSTMFNESMNQGGFHLKNTAVFTDEGKLKFLSIDDISYEKEAIVVSPGKGGLIGSPQQTIYGANFATLLNSNIKLKVPACVVRLENTSFVQLKMVPGSPQLGAKMQDSMEYLVIGVRHVGDTRGRSWYTYVTGCNKAGAIPPQLDPSRFYSMVS